MSGLPRRPLPVQSSSIPPPQQQAYPWTYRDDADDDDDVTWLDFLRTAGHTVPATAPPPPPPPVRSDSADRKRPHTGSSPPERRISRAVWSGRHPSDNNNNNNGHIRPLSGSTRETAIDLTSPPRFPPNMSRDQSVGGGNNDISRASGGRNTFFDSINTRLPSMASPNQGSLSGRRGSDTLPPRWQPDSDVNRCPICRTDFTFFYRKHHCRKCGRVVCAACSLHRITIPRQYIVQPPNGPLESGGVLLASPTSPHRSGLGGGEVVRVCNPCVPDPWTPDAGPDELSRDEEERRAVERREEMNRRMFPGRPGQRYRAAVAPPPFPPLDNRSRISPPPPQGDFSRSLPQGPSAQPWPFQDQYTRPTPPPPLTHQPPRQSVPHRHTQSSGSIPYPQGRLGTTSSPPPVPPPAPRPRHRRIVPEEDECPVCGAELPPGENIRQTHIQECINTRFSSTPSNSTNPPPGPPARVSSIPTNTTDSPSRPRATSYRPRGMAVYRATEKDCLTEEGEPQECVICFEEFQPGDEMGRMECLCKFHRVCIRAWWDTKGVGSCPTHMLHEG